MHVFALSEESESLVTRTMKKEECFILRVVLLVVIFCCWETGG
jgi:hypothetical protein